MSREQFDLSRIESADLKRARNISYSRWSASHHYFILLCTSRQHHRGASDGVIVHIDNRPLQDRTRVESDLP